MLTVFDMLKTAAVNYARYRTTRDEIANLPADIALDIGVFPRRRRADCPRSRLRQSRLKAGQDRDDPGAFAAPFWFLLTPHPKAV